jgi:hypothetical protein
VPFINWVVFEVFLRGYCNTAGWLSKFAKARYVPPLERVRTCCYARCYLAPTRNNEQLVRCPLARAPASSEPNLTASKAARRLRYVVTLRQNDRVWTRPNITGKQVGAAFTATVRKVNHTERTKPKWVRFHQWGIQCTKHIRPMFLVTVTRIISYFLLLSLRGTL